LTRDTRDPVALPTTRRDLFQPPTELRSLRERQPLCPLRYPDGHVGWLVTSHALARRVLADPRFTTSQQRALAGDPARNSAVNAAVEQMPEAAGGLLGLDPPEHSRVRRALARHFTVERVRAYATRIDETVERRLDVLERLGPPLDLVEEFATPVSALTLCALLGVPERDRARFERPTAVLIDDVPSTAEEKIETLRDFLSYCRSVLEQKREKPGLDILSELVAHGELSDDELVGAALDLFSAGHSTTSLMLGVSAFFLLSDPARARAFRTDPAARSRMVEELLRYLTIVPNGVGVAFTRTATADVEIDGTVIKAGQAVAVSLAAANRDPDRFADPDAFDIGRDAKGQLAFGHGRHVCLGQHLARAQMGTALGRLLERFPALRLAVRADEVHVSLALDRWPRELPVTW
jgi:cytochrome P450